MNIALTRHFEQLIQRLIASGRYNNASEVVRAGLRKLAAAEEAAGSLVLPSGSLRHLYSKEANAEERKTLGASILQVEPE